MANNIIFVACENLNDEELYPLLQHVQPNPADHNLVVIHATTVNLVVDDAFHALSTLATLSIKSKDKCLFIPIDLRRPDGYLVTEECKKLGYK